MESRVRLAVLLSVCGLCVPAAAQDSVSRHAGAPGDALNPYVAGEQRNLYVLDLTPFDGSWGTPFAVGPLLKSSAVASGFFNNLTGAQAISSDLIRNRCAPFPTYAFWTEPGRGVNDADNDPPGTLAAPGRGVQFAAALSEFGTTDAGAEYGGVITARVLYDPSDPLRLYVERVLAASNGVAPSENRSQFGVGAIDAFGNVHFRADGNGSTGPNALVDHNYFRVAAGDRMTGVVNTIDNTGFGDAGLIAPGKDSCWILQHSPTVHSTPNIMSKAIAGSPVLLGVNFAIEAVFEAAACAPSATMAHLCGAPDQRGTIAFSQRSQALGGVGMAGVLTKGPSGATDAISVWGVQASGAPTGQCRYLVLPTAGLTDACYGFTFATDDEFHLYHSQTPFRGGTSQAAIGRDQAGRTLVAGPVRDNLIGTPQAPINAIAVARFSGPTDPVEWTLAAWNNFPNGKPILNGPGGTAIGQLVELNQIAGAPLGPSMSAPAIDSVGNIWFVSAVELFTGPSGQAGDPLNDFDGALVRAVYDPDTFCYHLELVLQVGDVFIGRNSGRPYQVSFINLADADSVDSGGFWSENLLQEAAHGLSTAGLPTSDSRTLGGLILNARITYDSNGDQQFDVTVDENYRVALYIASAEPGSFCPADANGDDTLTPADFSTFRAQFLAGLPQADINCDGTLTAADFSAFRNAFLAGCP